MTTPSTPSESGPATPRTPGAFSGSAKHAAGGAKSAPASMAAPTATPVGGRAFASPAMLRILLTPATDDVTPEDFERMTSAIRRIESIRLSDLPKSTQRGESVPPTSSLAKAGEVHVTFVTSYDPSHAFLSPFNVHRQVLGVLGLAMCSSATAMSKLERAPAALRRMHPNAVVHRVFGFDVGATRPQSAAFAAGANTSIDESTDAFADEGDMGDGTLTRKSSEQMSQSNAPAQTSGFSGRQETGLVIFPAVRRDLKDVRFYLRTLVPNFIGDALDGLDRMVKDLQGKALETPRETLEGVLATSSTVTTTKTLGANVGAAASSAASRASALFSSFSSAEESSSSSRKVSRSGKSATQSVLSTGPTGSGRYAKVKADYYLLVGDLWNALNTYDQCMALLGKERAMAGGQDAVWYASALEGWAVARVLTARMGGQVEERAPSLTLPLGGVKEKEKDKSGANSLHTTAFAGHPWSDIAEAYSLALTIYSKCLAPASYLLDSARSVHPDTPRDYTHPLIHTSACLAYSRFLLSIWASGGWNGETFDQLLLGGVPPALAETTRPTLAVYTQHATASGVQRSDIAAPASQSMTNSSTNALKMLDQIHLYASLSAIFGCLGFARKEAYTIQRLQSLVIILIAHGIHLQGQQSKYTDRSQALRAGDAAHGTIMTQIMSVGGGHGSDSILVLALQVCQTYGINVQLMPLFDMSRDHVLLRASVDAKSGKPIRGSPMLNRSKSSSWDLSMSSPSQSSHWQQFSHEEAQARVTAITELLDEAPFGWTEQQVLILKDTISICEMLQDKTALLFFALIMLRDFWIHLGFEEQFKLKDGIAKIMAEVEGEKESMLQYWGPKDILTGIDLEASNESSAPSKVTFKDIANSNQAVAEWARKQIATSQAADDVLVQDEVVSFAVSLFNPLLVPLELESVRLELTPIGSLGPTFESDTLKSVILPPSSVHVVRVSGIPRGEGRLSVRGVHIKMPFCAERMFTYEYARGSSAKKTMWKAQGDLDDRWTRTKAFGLDARGSGSTGQGLPYALSMPPKARSRYQESLWLLTVIAKVPIAAIRPSPNLRSGNLILLDGEDQTVALTMLNQGDTPVDYIKFSCTDNVQQDVVDLLAEGTLEASDVYELEKDLLERPFCIRTGEETNLDAGQAKTFTFRLHGKLDVQRAGITVQYGNRAKSRELGREYFWVRQAKFTFDVRVLPTVFLDGLEFSATDKEDSLVSVSLAAHNAHPADVEVRLDIAESDQGIIQQKLAAHASVRLHFTLPRLAPRAMEETLYRPIPKLVERQFIVSRVQRSQDEENRQRARFWLRRAFVDRIRRVTWTDVRTGRTGTIGTTGLYVDSDDAARIVYGNRVQVMLKFVGGDIDKQEKINLQANDLVKLRITVRNVSDIAIRGRYRLESGGAMGERQPQGHDGQQHFLCISGHLHGQLRKPIDKEEYLVTGNVNDDALAPSLQPGEEVEAFVGLCFLSRGMFSLNAVVYNEREPENGKQASHVVQRTAQSIRNTHAGADANAIAAKADILAVQGINVYVN